MMSVVIPASGVHFPYQLNRRCESGSVVAPPHGVENRIASALQRDVEVGHQPPVLPQLQQSAGNLVGLQRRDAQTLHAGLGQYPLQQLQEAFAGNIEAVGSQLSAGQRHLAAALGGVAVDFGDDCFRRYAALPPADFGDDAVGAYLVAALLYLHHRAGAAYSANALSRRIGARAFPGRRRGFPLSRE